MARDRRSIHDLAHLPPRGRRVLQRLTPRLRRIIQQTRHYTLRSRCPPQSSPATYEDSMVYRYPLVLDSIFKQTILKSHLDRDTSVGAHVQRGWATVVVPRQGMWRFFAP